MVVEVVAASISKSYQLRLSCVAEKRHKKSAPSKALIRRNLTTWERPIYCAVGLQHIDMAELCLTLA